MSSNAQEYADALADEVARLDQAIADAYAFEHDGEGEAPDFDGTQWECAPDLIAHYLDTMALEVLDVTARSWAMMQRPAERRYVEVLRTFGGPNARVYFEDGERVTIRVHWGSDEGTAYVAAPYAASEVWEYADAVAGAFA